MNCLAYTGFDAAGPLLAVALFLVGAGIAIFAFRRGRRGSATLALLPLALGALLLTASPAPAQAATLHAASDTCSASGPNANDPGDPGNDPGGTNPGGGSPSPTPSPSPSSSTPPVCTPATYNSIDFGFPQWIVDTNFSVSPLPSLADKTEIDDLTANGTQGPYSLVVSDSATSYTMVLPYILNWNSTTNRDMVTSTPQIQAAVDNTVAHAPLTGAITVTATWNYSIDDGCGNPISVNIVYHGNWNAPPEIIT